MRAQVIPFDPALLKGLRERVHEKLRAAIVSGELPAGAVLNEREIAGSLGVSTTPVKEALRRLEGEGLIVVEPRRSARVCFDARRAEEMTLARAALESMIARMAATRVGATALRAIEEIFARMDAATRAGDARKLITLNERFHDAIHEASDCGYLRRVLVGQRVYDHATRVFLLGDPDECGRALTEHRAILDALAARDGDAAERAMRDHVVRSGREHIRTAFARRGLVTTAKVSIVSDKLERTRAPCAAKGDAGREDATPSGGTGAAKPGLARKLKRVSGDKVRHQHGSKRQ